MRDFVNMCKMNSASMSRIIQLLHCMGANLVDFKELFQAPSNELNSRSGQSNLAESNRN